MFFYRSILSWRKWISRFSLSTSAGAVFLFDNLDIKQPSAGRTDEKSPGDPCDYVIMGVIIPSNHVKQLLSLEKVIWSYYTDERKTK